MSCNLYLKPFITRDAAKAAMASITGSFAVTKISNDPKWWYVISKEGTTYYINFKDGRFQVPAAAQRTFDVLYSQLNIDTNIEDNSVYIRREDLVNLYTYDTPIMIKSIISEPRPVGSPP